MLFEKSALRFVAFGLTMGLAFVSLPSAMAQVDKGLLDCRVLPDPTSRLFCYDRFVDGALRNPSRAAPPAPTPTAPVAPVLRAPPPSAATPVPAPVPTPAPSPATPVTPVQPSKPASPAPVTPAKPAVPVQNAAPAQKFGEENLPSAKREQPADAQPETMRARVVKVATDAYGATVVTLDNGQVWKQTEGTKYRVGTGAAVTISRGMLGAFFLKADNSSLAVKFKRIE